MWPFISRQATTTHALADRSLLRLLPSGSWRPGALRLRARRWLMTTTLVLVTASAHAQPPFYQGKTITIISGASGGYDTYAHLLATHMKKYIAGAPTLIARSMPGAGSMVAANYLYNVSA